MNRYAPSLTDAQFAALPLSERFVLVAAHYCDVVKVHEQPRGSNRGPEIDQWLRDCGAPLGSPWCGAFVTACLQGAGYTGPMPKNTASTHSWADWADDTGHALVSTAPRRGDIFVLLLSPTTGHMGVVVGRDGAASRTIEGNSNDDGGREGYEVVRHERVLSPSPVRVCIRLV